MKETNENLSNELLSAKSEQLLNNKNLQDNNLELEKMFDEFKDLKSKNVQIQNERDSLQKTVYDLQNKISILTNKTNNLDNLIKEKENSLHETRKTNTELNFKIKNMENNLYSTETNFRINDNKLFMINNDNEILKNK